MRTDYLDRLADITNRSFLKSRLTISQFIETLVDVGVAFDCTESSYHAIDNGEIVSFYFAGNQWNAKY